MKKKAAVLFLYLLWTINASAQNLNNPAASLFAQMTEAIKSKKYVDIHSVLISEGTKLTYEQYFDGFKQDSLHDSRSSFKSVTSLLVGIAIDRGFIKDVNQKVCDFFPGHAAFKKDQSKRDITIKNLLEMESGLNCEEFNDTKDCEDEMSLSKDWVNFSLNIPMKYKPGKRWAYTSFNPVILGGIISKASHMSVMDFAKKYLFDPLKISKYKWTVDPSGNGMTAGSFYILPRDMMKIGQLVRYQGIWNGKQVVSKNWISQSTKCDIAIPDFSFMKSSRSSIGFPQQTRYGYYWYREALETSSFKQDVLFASGNGGQYIFILKDLGLTVVFTQGNYGSFKAKQAFEMLAKYIIPAFKN